MKIKTDSGRAEGGGNAFYILFCLEGKVGNKIKPMTPTNRAVGGGERGGILCYFDGVLLGL